MILGIDTSTSTLSLALKKDDGQVFLYHEHQLKRHGETIIPQLEKLLLETGLSTQAIKGIAVGLGPGSFTGIRIGVATAVALAQALEVPIVGLPGYAIVAANHVVPCVLVVGDARREKLYLAGYRQQGNEMNQFIDETLTDIKDVVRQCPDGPVYLSGPEAALFYDQLKKERNELILMDENYCQPLASTLIELAEPVLKNGGMPIEEIVPIYLRKTQAEEMKAHAGSKH